MSPSEYTILESCQSEKEPREFLILYRRLDISELKKAHQAHDWGKYSK